MKINRVTNLTIAGPLDFHENVGSAPAHFMAEYNSQHPSQLSGIQDGSYLPGISSSAIETANHERKSKHKRCLNHCT